MDAPLKKNRTCIVTFFFSSGRFLQDYILALVSLVYDVVVFLFCWQLGVGIGFVWCYCILVLLQLGDEAEILVHVVSARNADIGAVVEVLYASFNIWGLKFHLFLLN